MSNEKPKGMTYYKGMRLKVIETEHCLIIGREAVNVKGGAPLLMSDEPGPILQYLDRYLYGRLNGESLDVAHNAAIKVAGVTMFLPPSAAKTIPLTEGLEIGTDSKKAH